MGYYIVRRIRLIVVKSPPPPPPPLPPPDDGSNTKAFLIVCALVAGLIALQVALGSF
jgi:hypothetical protein